MTVIAGRVRRREQRSSLEDMLLVAGHLGPLSEAGAIEVLHEVSDGRALIDHVVVAASGVLVVTTAHTGGSRVRVRTRGGITTERRSDLFLGRTQRTDLAEIAARHAVVVERVLAQRGVIDVPVTGVLCVTDSDLGRRHLAGVVEGVQVLDGHGLERLATAGGPLPATRRREVTGRLLAPHVDAA